jgi:site-specific DNA-methyltransferase (adenine-specific)
MLPFQLISTDVARQKELQQIYMSEHGILYQGDCLQLLSALPDESVDLIFADPPFNLGKEYGEGINDQMELDKYLNWSQQWLNESIRAD